MLPLTLEYFIPLHYDNANPQGLLIKMAWGDDVIEQLCDSYSQLFSLLGQVQDEEAR